MESTAAYDQAPLIAMQSTLCPGWGLKNSPTTMKVIKIAEYFPIISTFVGCVHLVYAIKKYHEGEKNACQHIQRALVAIINTVFLGMFGLWVLLFDSQEDQLSTAAQHRALHRAQEALTNLAQSEDRFTRAQASYKKALHWKKLAQTGKDVEEIIFACNHLEKTIQTANFEAENVIKAANPYTTHENPDKRAYAQHLLKKAQETTEQVRSHNQNLIQRINNHATMSSQIH